MTELPQTDPYTPLVTAARQLGDASVESSLVALRERLDEGRFFVACVGQFKRGKSTLLNGLLGDEVLPVGVLPVTAVVTVVRYGEEHRVRVLRHGEGWLEIDPADLSAYVTEEQNPENVRRVAAVEVFEPSPLLLSGMCLVDTPGVGSIFAGNTAATRAFVPHIDAALLVLGADPPISGDELELVREVARDVRDWVVVLNKADRMSAADTEQARTFTRRVLEQRFGRELPEVLTVSAAERRERGPTRDWALLEGRLTSLARGAGAHLLRSARRRGIGDAVERLTRDLAEHRAALRRPVDESARRLEAMSRAVNDGETAVRDLQHLFRAEEDAIRGSLEARRAAFLAGALPEAMADLALRVQSCEQGGAALRARSFELAQQIAGARVTRWVESVDADAEESYSRAMLRFVALANELLKHLRAAEGEALDGLPEELDPQVGFRERSRFFFTDLLHLTQSGPISAILDALRSRERATTSTLRRAKPYLERLMETNSTRVVNDLVDRVRESGSRLCSELVSLLRSTTGVAQRSLERARRASEAGQSAAEEQLAELDRLERTIRAVGGTVHSLSEGV